MKESTINYSKSYVQSYHKLTAQTNIRTEHYGLIYRLFL